MKQAATAAMLPPNSNQYPPMMGLPELRQAVAAHSGRHAGTQGPFAVLLSWWHVAYAPGDILLSKSATSCLGRQAATAAILITHE